MTRSIDYPEQMERDRAEIERLRAALEGCEAELKAARAALAKMADERPLPPDEPVG